MRQIQLDYFTKSIEAVLGDINRVFQTRSPVEWQVAWAMDLKTQQGKFPKDVVIRRIKEQFANQKTQVERRKALLGIIEWYHGFCASGGALGVSSDYEQNSKDWSTRIEEGRLDGEDKYEALQFTFRMSITALAQDGGYQADAFQRRAAIIFGEGEVHGIIVSFSQ
jgi:hypothetical protein